MENLKVESKDPSLVMQNGDSLAIKGEGVYDPHIKQEPRYDHDVPGYHGMNGYPGNAINPMAGQRATNNLIQQFGSQATASLRAAGLPQQPRPLSLPGQPQQQHQQQHRQAQPTPQYPLGQAQTDGAVPEPEDAHLTWKQRWENMVLQARETDPQEQLVADRLLHRIMTENEIDEESQILMVDSRRKKQPKLKNRALPPPQRQMAGLSIASSSKASSSLAPSADHMQVDGGDDEFDEDAINSDLDDSEEEIDGQQADDDGPLGEMILCTWDKVNRVKNKVSGVIYILSLHKNPQNGTSKRKASVVLTWYFQWRCTLKDGILTTGGKE
jgi:transcription initiation factor TFIIA large subunit